MMISNFFPNWRKCDWFDKYESYKSRFCNNKEGWQLVDSFGSNGLIKSFAAYLTVIAYIKRLIVHPKSHFLNKDSIEYYKTWQK